MEIDNQTVDTWTNTQLKVVKFTHKWTISNFSFGQKKMTSSTFVTNDDVKWCLELYPYGTGHEKYKDFVSVFLLLKESERNEVRAKFKFSVINDKNQLTHCRKIQEAHTFVLNKSGRDYGYSEFMERSVLLDKANGLLPGDKLTILCKIAVVTEIVNANGLSSLQQFQIPQYQLLDRLEMSLETQKFSDVTLTVCGREFRAHKVILAAASPVFAAMFEHEMAERKSNQVEVTDINPNTFEVMLRFIYTGKTPDVEQMTGDLLSVSDKYDLKRLKALCEMTLFNNLSVESAADTLMLADLYNSELLKGLVIDFISANTRDIMETPSFATMAHSHPHLVTEVLRALAIKNTMHSNK